MPGPKYAFKLNFKLLDAAKGNRWKRRDVGNGRGK
jgi:hypothetical protein